MRLSSQQVALTPSTDGWILQECAGRKQIAARFINMTHCVFVFLPLVIVSSSTIYPHLQFFPLTVYCDFIAYFSLNTCVHHLQNHCKIMIKVSIAKKLTFINLNGFVVVTANFEWERLYKFGS